MIIAVDFHYSFFFSFDVRFRLFVVSLISFALIGQRARLGVRAISVAGFARFWVGRRLKEAEAAWRRFIEGSIEERGIGRKSLWS